MLRRAIILFTPFIRRSLLTGGLFLERPFQVTRTDPAVNRLALIVRGADTDSFDLAPQAAGLWAISAGLSYNYKDDHEQLSIGMKIYDALYSWAKYAYDEKYTWTQKI